MQGRTEIAFRLDGAGEMKGYGLPRFLEVVNVKGGYIRRRWITLKTLSSSINLGCGMSCGVEGPIAQIGGSIGSTVARALRPRPQRLRVLIACGSASAQVLTAEYTAPMRYLVGDSLTAQRAAASGS